MDKWVWFLYGVGASWASLGVLAGLLLLLVGRRSKEKTPGVALTFEERRRRWPREVR